MHTKTDSIQTTGELRTFQDILKGGDLRSIGKANEIAALVKSQADFDNLFIGLMKLTERL